MKNCPNARGVNSARIVKVIETKVVVGRGTVDEPAELLTQYWSLDGEMLGEGKEKAATIPDEIKKYLV